MLIKKGKKMNSYDARVRYTLKVIEDSFLELLGKKPIARITVTELCQTALINRATFYKHYLDIPDLLKKTEEKLFEQIKELCEDPQNDQELFLKLMHYLKNGIRRYMVLGLETADPQLPFKTLKRCMQWSFPITASCAGGMDTQKQAMLHSMLSFAVGGILSSWIQNGMEETPEYIARLAGTLCTHMIAGIKKGEILL